MANAFDKNKGHQASMNVLQPRIFDKQQSESQVEQML